MAAEIERKFLVDGDGYKAMATGVRRIMQGYLSTQVGCTVRVRVADEPDDTCRAYLTIKGANRGAERAEFEYEIPFEDGMTLLNMCERRIKKIRHLVPWDGLLWEVDEFLDALDGLVVAEVELDRADRPLSPPPFVTREVTSDPRYYNSHLSTLSSPPQR